MRKNKDYLPKLLEYIEIVNKIPMNFEFPTLDYVFELAIEKPGKESKSVNIEEMTEVYEESFASKLPQDLHEFVMDKGEVNNWDEYLAIQRNFDYLASIDHGLRAMAYAVTEEFRDNLGLTINETIEGWVSENVFSLPLMVAINKKGHLVLKTTEFFEFIRDHEIEARRIRECFVCFKVFWAKRLETWTCSKQCGNIWRQHKWQKKNKDLYNERRRNNYAYKQAIKNLKEKKNGNLQTRQNLVDEFQLQRKAHPKKHEN